jgi:hypothetical protein
MRYWVFHEQTLAAALAAHELDRQKEGASEQQAKDETQIIVAFLAKAAALQGVKAPT